MISIIGEIVVDVILGSDAQNHKMRLGGVIHAALACWAINQEYEIYYYAPLYLDEEIQRYLLNHGCMNAIRIGDTENAPGIILIGEPKETGDQQYSVLMSDTATYANNSLSISIKGSNAIIFPGNYDLSSLLERVSSNPHNILFHIDIANGINSIEDLLKLKSLERRFSTIFNSTSHHIKSDSNNINFEIIDKCLDEYCDAFILKENRGGGRLFRRGAETISYPAFIQEISHSVGVGDCFDIAYIHFINKDPDESLRFASAIASEYAFTSFPDDLKYNITRLKDNLSPYSTMAGIHIPWELRGRFKIYVAAPDFDWVNTIHIRRLESSLQYHNFTPLLPIKINGQLDDPTIKKDASRVFEADIDLIHEADILIAVLINDDHGTLIEIGYAAGIGKPVIVYDPDKLGKNPMITQLPRMISNDLDSIINEVYKIASIKE